MLISLLGLAGMGTGLLPDFSLFTSGLGLAVIGTLSRLVGGIIGVFGGRGGFAWSEEICRIRGDCSLGLLGDTVGDAICLTGEVDWSVGGAGRGGGGGGSSSSTIGTTSSFFRERTGDTEGTGVTFLLAINRIV